MFMYVCLFFQFVLFILEISGCLLGICCHFAYLGTSTCTYNNLECVAVIARCNVLIIHLDVLLLTVKTWL